MVAVLECERESSEERYIAAMMRCTTNAPAGPESGQNPYPWYDSLWLMRYARAKAIVAAERPDRLASFVDAFRILHTRPNFTPRLLHAPFEADVLDEIRRVAGALRPAELELHEARTFRRFLVHDHPSFTQLQERATALIEEVVGEPVDASYNFLSLYTSTGVCPVHMDAPDAKWTLDLCVDQPVQWPIYLSDVRAWPEPEGHDWRGGDWERRIKSSERFTRYDLRPGQALVFSGSSQFHYRDPLPPGRDSGVGSTMLFLHFIPRGAAEIVRPENWARLFDMRELAMA
jgi:hypothetical protein